jgi:hypothetical protein
MPNGYKYIKTKTGQSLFDLAIQEYGNVNTVFKMLADNSFLSIDSVASANLNILIDLNFKVLKESFNEAHVAQKTKYFETALGNQNLWDIALQEFGTIEAVFQFMALNNINSIDSNLIANKRYKLPADAIIQKHIKEHYAKAETKITTGIKNWKARLVETGEVRLTEDGGIRIIE